jgi:23S rRNA pseudouridine2605 synthase
MLERIQKIIAAAGVTSRRAAEELIAEGRVRVNGQVVTEAGTKADASKDHIKVDGKLINPQQPKVYVMLNKPAGYVTTMSDPEGRHTVQDLLKGIKARVYPVGRLDYNTEGMLILTNDGDFAHLITHPKHEFPKTYLAKVKGVLEESQISSLEQGIYLDDGKTAPAKLKKVRKEEANSWLEITIHEGRKRQVRRMFDRVGHSVIRLKRIRTGGMALGGLPEGAFRYLTPSEVRGLQEMAQRTGDKGQGPKSEGQKAGVRAQGSGIRRQDTGSKSRTTGGRPQGLGGRGQGSGGMHGRKPAHRGAQADSRPWRAEFMKKEEGRGSGIKGRGVVSSYGRPVKKASGQKARVRIPSMQDTREGLRKNQRVKASATQQKRSFDGPRAAAGSTPRRDSTFKPTSRPISSRPTMRTGTNRPATGVVSGKPEFRKKPDQRPWPSTRKSGTGSKGTGSVPGFGPRKDSRVRPATRPGMGRPTTGATDRRPATGAVPGRPATRRKPDPRSWPGSKGSGPGRRGPGNEGRGRRPGSGPRPNKSSHPAGKGPRNKNRPAGSRGPGQGAGRRGPRR